MTKLIALTLASLIIGVVSELRTPYYGRYVGMLSSEQYVVSGVVWLSNEREILITDFTYQPPLFQLTNVTFTVGPTEKTGNDFVDMTANTYGLHLVPELVKPAVLRNFKTIVAKQPTETEQSSIALGRGRQRHNPCIVANSSTSHNASDSSKPEPEPGKLKSADQSKSIPKPEPEPSSTKSSTPKSFLIVNEEQPIKKKTVKRSPPANDLSRLITANDLPLQLRRWRPPVSFGSNIPNSPPEIPSSLDDVTQFATSSPGPRRFFVETSPTGTFLIRRGDLTTRRPDATTLSSTSLPPPLVTSLKTIQTSTDGKITRLITAGSLLRTSATSTSTTVGPPATTTLLGTTTTTASHENATDTHLGHAEAENSTSKTTSTPPVEPLAFYYHASIMLRLPASMTIRDIHWLSMWDNFRNAPVTTVLIPNGPSFSPPQPTYIKGLGPATSFKEVRSGPIEIVNAKTIRIHDFYFEGDAPGAWFMAGQSVIPNAISGHVIPIMRDDGSFDCDFLQPYCNQTVTLKLPGTIEIHDVFWLSVFCVPYSISFAHRYFPYRDIQVPADTAQEDVPYCQLASR